MKEAVYKISSASIVIGLVIFMWFASKDMQRAKMIEQAVTVEKRDESNSKMTEEEAAKAVFYYIYSDYDYNSMVTVGMTSEAWYIHTRRRNRNLLKMKCSIAKV